MVKVMALPHQLQLYLHVIVAKALVQERDPKAPTPITREHGADARERSQHFRRYSAQTSTASRGAAAAAAAAAAFYALLF